MNLSILRNSIEIATVSIDEKTKFTHKIMGEHKITSSFYAVTPLDIQIGDYIEWKNNTYAINQLPSLKKVSNTSYYYTAIFEAVEYNLYNKLFMDEGAADFSYHGTAEDHLNLLLTNINSTDAGWTIANIDATESKTISYAGVNCRNAINTIAKEFELEWKLDAKAFTMQKTVGVATTHTFEYGRGKGLYSLARGVIDDANVVTRVYGFGSEKNLSHEYRDGKKRLVFDALTLEANTSLYGIREGVFTDDSIYPTRTGTVSAVDNDSIFKIIDTSIDFDINDQLLEGVVAKIVFKTGALAGYEFEISNYNNSTKEITFIKFVEENDYELPNDLNKPVVGDTYTLIDINMPQSYIDAAEANLLTKTQEYLDENSSPQVSYVLDLDEKFIRDNAIAISPADTVQLVDTDLGVDKVIRVTQISYPLVNENLVKAVISDTIPYTVQQHAIKNTIENNKLIKNVDRSAIERTRRASKRTRDLQNLIYDTDGYFDMEYIKPLGIDTSMLSVGVKSRDFGLLDVRIEPNSGGNANSLSISAGQLVHNQISIDGLGYVWNLPLASFNTLVTGNTYYVFAKCSKTSLTGTWYISTQQKKVEDEAGFYLFQLGVLFNVLDGHRDFDFTNGVTYIVGDTIKTGKIQSLDGFNFFDLTGNQFRVGNSSSSMDWNVTAANQLTLKNVKLKSGSGDEFPAVVYRGVFIPFNVYYKGDQVTHQGQLYNYISDTPSSDLPDLSSKWTLTVVKGADGVDGEKGDTGSNGVAGQDGQNGVDGLDGQSLYTWIKYADDINGSGITSNPSGKPYIGLSYNNSSSSASNTPEDYSWSKIEGEKGNSGASIVFRGDFLASNFYYNNDNRRDVVKYGSDYKIYKGSNNTSQGWNSLNWDDFGAQFENIATGTLFAEGANIANFLFKSGVMESQNQTGGNPNMKIDGTTGIIRMTGLSSERNYSEIKKEGVFIETEGDDFRTPESQSGSSWKSGNATILENNMQSGNSPNSGNNQGSLLAAVYGKATNTYHVLRERTRYFGGYFVRCMIRGLFVKYIFNQSSTYEIEFHGSDEVVVVNEYSGSTIKLPVVGYGDRGRIVIVKNLNGKSCSVNGNGLKVNESTSNYSMSSTDSRTFLYVGERNTDAVLQTTGEWVIIGSHS